jgi:hypothetical protein
LRVVLVRYSGQADCIDTLDLVCWVLMLNRDRFESKAFEGPRTNPPKAQMNVAEDAPLKRNSG